MRTQSNSPEKSELAPLVRPLYSVNILQAGSSDQIIYCRKNRAQGKSDSQKVPNWTISCKIPPQTGLEFRTPTAKCVPLACCFPLK